MGPLTLPQMPQLKRKRRWKLFLLWSILMFAGGAAAGVALIDQVCGGIESVASTLGLHAPGFVANRRTVAPVPSPTAVPPVPEPVSTPEPVPTAPAIGQGQAVAAKPAAIPAEAKPAPELAAPAAREPAPHEPKVAHHVAAVAPARAEPAEPEPERVPHGKGAAKTASSAGTSSKKSGKFDDPFASDGETANEPKPAAVSGKAKAAASEPAPRPTAKSNDSLDNLMADGVADSKGKKRDSKDLDALLKDVQKSKPEPKAKHEDSPPPAAALSPSDISRVMAGVKTRSNDCAHRLGQKGNAELKITVGKDGHVSDVSLGGNVANTPLGACIEKVTRAAVFPASSGLRFDYRMEAR
jgi:hypothetical protein